MSLDTACIFVDGENLRHSLVDLFYNEFDPRDYLPKNADWAGFFNYLVKESGAKTLLRTYWYVVDEIDYFPHGNWAGAPQTKLAVLCKHAPFKIELDRLTGPEKDKRAYDLAGMILAEEKRMNNKFYGWRTVQDGIARRVERIEFRRAGSIRYNLFEKRLHNEKAVDVYLAIDLLQLRDIYDVAIIVSGDQDYVPAVQAIKNSGKAAVNVSFKERRGRLLPGGARRLNLKTDKVVEMEYNDVLRFMKLNAQAQPSNQGRFFNQLK